MEIRNVWSHQRNLELHRVPEAVQRRAVQGSKGKGCSVDGSLDGEGVRGSVSKGQNSETLKLAQKNVWTKIWVPQLLERSHGMLAKVKWLAKMGCREMWPKIGHKN